MRNAAGLGTRLCARMPESLASGIWGLVQERGGASVNVCVGGRGGGGGGWVPATVHADPWRILMPWHPPGSAQPGTRAAAE